MILEEYTKCFQLLDGIWYIGKIFFLYVLKEEEMMKRKLIANIIIFAIAASMWNGRVTQDLSFSKEGCVSGLFASDGEACDAIISIKSIDQQC